MASSIEELSVWVKENKLKTNDDKTELIFILSKSKLKQVNTSSMVFQDCETIFSESVRNLGKFLDESLSKEIYVNQLCKVLYFHVANTLAVAFILSRLDPCSWTTLLDACAASC